MGYIYYPLGRGDREDRPHLDGRGIHCGDVIEVLCGAGWVPVRVEYDWGRDVWYYDGGDGGILAAGLPARWPRGRG